MRRCRSGLVRHVRATSSFSRRFCINCTGLGIAFAVCRFQQSSSAGIFIAREKTRDVLASCHRVVFFFHRHVALVKVNRKKKKQQTTVIQQQSASRVQLPSLSAAKERKHGKRRQLSARITKQTKARAHAESDDSSGQVSVQSGECNRSDSEGSASSTANDDSSEGVVAMSQQTTHVHKKKRATLRRKNSGHKAFPTSCSSVASGRGSLKRAHHLKAINKARLPLALFIGLPDLHVIKLRFVLTSRTKTNSARRCACLLPFARGQGLDQDS